MLSQAGYLVLEEKLTVIPIELVLGLSPENVLCRVLTRCLSFVTRLMPGLFGYQIVLRGMPRPLRAEQ